MMLTFDLKVIEGRNLKGKDFGGLSSDPFVKIITNQCTQQTNYISNTRNPYWNQSFNLQLYPNESIKFEVWDYDRFGKNDYLGSTSYKPFFNNSPIIDTWLSVNKKGELHIQLLNKNINYNQPQCMGYSHVNTQVPTYGPPNVVPNVVPTYVQNYNPQYPVPQPVPQYTPPQNLNYNQFNPHVVPPVVPPVVPHVVPPVVPPAVPYGVSHGYPNGSTYGTSYGTPF